MSQKKSNAISDNSEKLIMRIQNNDEVALSQLHKVYKQHLYYFVNKKLEDRNESWRIVSDAFYKFWVHRHKPNSPQQAISYLYKTCNNMAVDVLRQRERLKNRAVIQYEEWSEENMPMSDSDVLRNLIEFEVITEIAHAIDTLPLNRRKVMQLLFIEGLSIFEVAEALNMSPGLVRTTKFQAIEQLRKKLGAVLLAILMASLVSSLIKSLAMLPQGSKDTNAAEIGGSSLRNSLRTQWQEFPEMAGRKLDKQ